MELQGVDADGVKTSGHVFDLMHSGNGETARRFVADLVEQERTARVRLINEFPRVFGDSLCRALAILKNCRLLSPGELFDLLSPLRLAALDRMLEGIAIGEIETILAGVDLSSSEDKLSQDERDRVDAQRADEMNRRFENVVLNELAEDRFLKL
jgi:protein-arginine kinase